MAFLPDSAFDLKRDTVVAKAQRLAGRFLHPAAGHSRYFSPEETLLHAQNIDRRLQAQAPMSADGIDVATNIGLSQLGMRHARLITEQTHPELYAAWTRLNARAGFDKPRQLILVDSDAINAASVSEEEIVVTTGLFKLMNLREVVAILGHELAHSSHEETGNNRILGSMALTAGGVFVGGAAGTAVEHASIAHRLNHLPEFKNMTEAVLALQAMRPSWWAGIVHWAMVALGGALGFVVSQQATVKPSELQADLEGVAISGDPEGFISAMQKLDKATRRGTWETIFAYAKSGYPTAQERIDHMRRVGPQITAARQPVVEEVASAVPAPLQAQPTVNKIETAERLEAAPGLAQQPA